MKKFYRLIIWNEDDAFIREYKTLLEKKVEQAYYERLGYRVKAEKMVVEKRVSKSLTKYFI